MISCFRRGSKNKGQCVRTSFFTSFLNRSAEYFGVSILCSGKKAEGETACVLQAAKAFHSLRGNKSHHRRVSEVDFTKTYKLGKTLGVGGFSVVKTGTNILTGEPVAIKIIDRSKYGPKDGSLEREIQVLEKVQHPNCICFKECFFTSKSVYLITELVTGGELLERVLAKGRYTELEAATTINQVLNGVAYLHSIGIVHRDLKLENILLKSKDDDSVVKIADFGLSKIFVGAAILSTICGSPQYVAPEVLEVGQKRSSYTPSADLWSVGVILYILLSGYSPFDDVSESALFKKIKKGQYSFKASVWETISNDAKDLVRGLLCVIPDQRLTASQALAHPWIKKYLDHNVQNIVHDNNDAEKVLVSNQHTIKSIQNHHVLDESSSDSDDNDICSSSVPNKLHSFSPSNSTSNLQNTAIYRTSSDSFHSPTPEHSFQISLAT
ncbi:hypothetical protein MPTK1_1g00950 [Marchantia polymorpha subsp. ruderalis]|uniref:Protein kinase domain-containing protein n=2 Tax=Marchantia polymorpha TaxID=3197 RepID=A0AAF6AK48_MARPO|nr:hypothetical protein MARPO_0029s0151 [Marchantia polymorpha]BBM96818.1 hypothetical protein Mp_1g00950 [Marchantia polymorpha subsp. ruderalis]|eukprot:PTQ42665.1 hypothetical protein MARPO_0029s0151 [Marchantia polymorpha]